MKEISCTELRGNMASVLDRVTKGKRSIAVSRNGKRIVVMAPAAEWEGLKETVHLLLSPRNAQRLLGTLARAEAAELRDRNSLRGGR